MNIDHLIKYYNEDVEVGYERYSRSYVFQVIITIMYFSQIIYIPYYVIQDFTYTKGFLAFTAFIIYIFSIGKITYDIRKEEQRILELNNHPYVQVSMFKKSYPKELFFNYEVEMVKNYMRKKGLNDRTELDIVIKRIKEKSRKDFNLYITIFSALYIPVWIQVISKHIEYSKDSLVVIACNYFFGVIIICIGVGIFKKYGSEIKMIFIKPDKYRLYKLHQILKNIVLTD